jgi:hypothetical protein
MYKFLQRYAKSDNSKMFFHDESRHPRLLCLNNFVCFCGVAVLAIVTGGLGGGGGPSFSSVLAHRYRRIAEYDLKQATIESFPFMRLPRFPAVVKPLTKHETSSFEKKNAMIS